MAKAEDAVVKLEVLGQCRSCKSWHAEMLETTAEAMRRCHMVEVDGAPVMAIGVGGWDASVYTRPEFGCVMWEGKDAR